ncbi:phage integrase Arm DNA-binding domain-containing protein [Ralstonia insidiosa]|uniref:tyrosine-type recombinase/integrase n=1 Tax=Ralstonia TaxID=48736 RepID=UPI00076EA477|nr:MULTISPECIES: tyrosine-type recombinase/integrase [Ralstonia]MBY4707325.1 phage integrase Arm DNA-binding domain-containing protein [Ralstonia insidiosa]GAQ29091.1 hypothetical protein SAMD00023378_2774 [Ralstonia sp. NT80]
MAGRPRIRRRANWPANLHEPRPGYYTYRDPRDGRVHILGRVPMAQAIFEVHEANAFLVSTPRKLVARLGDMGTETIRDLISKMPKEGLKQTTLSSHLTQDRKIEEALGDIRCNELTTKAIASFIEQLKTDGKKRFAQMIRSRLINICQKGVALGWMQSNPASVIEKFSVKVQRKRLTLEAFLMILAKAPEVAPWLENAMLLALVSGQDRSTIARWEQTSIQGDFAIVRRSKTEVDIAIPLDLRLDTIGLSLRDVIARCKRAGVVSRYLIHHIKPSGSTKRGAPIALNGVSSAFAEARVLAGLTEVGAPTFHEIRSLTSRLYKAQGNVDTKALLGHLSDSAANTYQNPRGIEPIKVAVTTR